MKSTVTVLKPEDLGEVLPQDGAFYKDISGAKKGYYAQKSQRQAEQAARDAAFLAAKKEEANSLKQKVMVVSIAIITIIVIVALKATHVI